MSDATIASPLCMYQNCKRNGRAVLGPERQMSPDCVNRSITCLTCGCTGDQSQNLRAKTPKKTEAA